MFTPSDSIFLKPDIVNFYMNHLKEHGDSSQGVGWKNDLAQQVRFSQLVKVIQHDRDFSINDFGCGTGELYTYLCAQNFVEINYHGYDILDDMVNLAEQKLRQFPNVTIQKIKTPMAIKTADYSVMSGVFNVKYDAPDVEWREHISGTLSLINERSRLGFSFNLLSLYSDVEFRKPYLYYADPLFFFDFCKKHFSRNVALLHDYDQYDFTILVRKK